MDTNILRVLRSHPVTRSLSAEDLDYLMQYVRVVCYLPGTYIYHESQPRREFGILLKGRVEIRKGLRGRTRTLAVIGPGESFGEGSLLDDYPHSTSAYVAEPCEVV